MDYKIKYSPRAMADLDSIMAFVGKVSPEAARNQIGRIRQKINRLTFMPSGFDFDDRLGRQLHGSYKTEVIICDTYLILFVVIEKTKEVIITQIIPSRSDYMRILK